jgi:trehalose/maltose hydrolase-like predicted phosphorylase
VADWIRPGNPLGTVAAIGIVAGVGSGLPPPESTAGLLGALAASCMQIAIVGAQPTPAAGPWRHLPGQMALRHWVADLSTEHGIGPGLVALLIDGPVAPHLEVVPRLRLVELATSGRPGDLDWRLREQARRVAQGEVVGVDFDPMWVVALERGGTPEVRVDEAIGTVADGRFGTRGSLEEGGRDAHELVLANGVYTAQPLPTGLPCPLWTTVDLDPLPGPGRRWLDLRTGVLLREVDATTARPSLRSMRFACLVRPGTVVLRLQGPLREAGGPAVRGPAPVPGVEGVGGCEGDHAWAATWSGQAQVVAEGIRHGHADRLDRLACYVVADDLISGRRAAGAGLAAADTAGVAHLIAEQRRVWAERWQDADVTIEGDVELTRTVRFAVHHLLASVPDIGEAAVGARGLTGPAYAGHVFWDADVFVLPALAAVRPQAARAMLAYRLARLPQARAAAAARGHRGACFPWESAGEGDDVTPRTVVDADGDLIPVLTGTHAIHITADVAWAACRYATWAGDRDWLAGPGRDLVVEPARFWASRVEIDDDGTGHLRGVVGPDEYHGPVDDDIYTNVLARWNLRAAAALLADDRDPSTIAERQQWLDVAERLVVHHDPSTGRHEQFDGFDALEPLIISTIADVPVAADVLLGRERVAGAQVCKQPDVLMAHHLVPDEMTSGSLGPDLDHEGPRLAHGSSLSPAIVAALLARAGRPDEAEPLFRLAARLDLDDVTGTTAGGLHLATMGGVWQALAGGFAGIEPTAEALVIDPHLPSAWAGVLVTVRYHGVRVRVEVRHASVTVTSDGPLPIRHGHDGEVEIVDGRRRHPLDAVDPSAKAPS